MKTSLLLLLSALVLPLSNAAAQGIQLTEILLTAEPAAGDFESLRTKASLWGSKAPGTELHLLRADRGRQSDEPILVWTFDSPDRRGAYPAANGLPFSKDLLESAGVASYVDDYAEYELIGGAAELPIVEILGFHYQQVRPGREEAFERFVTDTLYAALANRTPGMHLLYYRNVNGASVSNYATLYAIETVATRELYWPTGAPETEAVKSGFRPLKAVALSLSKYLVPGSYLEEDSGAAAAYFESLDWTDYVHQVAPAGYTSIFDGRTFNGWKVPEGDNGHWKVIDGVIDYDAESESSGDKSLWTQKEYEDFVLYVDWRIKATPWDNPNVPLILPSGLHKRNENGEEIRMIVPDSDSGILFRGPNQAQANIWGWPIGSGEVYGYRMDEDMPAEVRAAVTPKLNADNNIGEWNTFRITLRDNILTVELNGKTVIKEAELPGLPGRGPIGLQHHGGKRDGEWVSPPSLVQFRNIYVREL